MSAEGGIALVCVECGAASDRTPCVTCSAALDRAAIARDELLRWKRAPSLSKGRL